MAKRMMIVFLLLCVCVACAGASAEGAGISLVASEDAPVLALQRSANFREMDAPCGAAYLLYADGTLEVYAILARQNADESMLTSVGEISQAEYQGIERLLHEAEVLDMPDEIPNNILDGDTVTLTLWTAAGKKSITGQSPDGLPFGDVAKALEAIFQAYKERPAPALSDVDWGDCMPPEPTYTPDMPAYHEKQGDAYYGQGEYEMAIASFETAVAIDPSSMNGYYGLAMTYRAMGLLMLSIENYSVVIALAPDYAQPYELRAQIYQFLRRYEEAEADLNRYVQLYGQYPIPYIARGDFYMDRGEYQKAADDYSAALGKGLATSAFSGVYLKRAAAWLKLGDIDSATSDCNAALEHHK